MRTILFRVKGTVILKIWWQILLVSLYSVGVVSLFKYVLNWEPNLQENMENGTFQKENTVGIFGLFTGFLLVFRTNTAYDRYWEGRKLWSSMTYNIRTLTRLIWTMISINKEGCTSTNKSLIEKISTMNLLIAFAYSTRNYLREEHSYESKDLKHFLKHLPKIFKNQEGIDSIPPRNTPIEISHLIMSYIKTVRERDLVDDPTANIMNGCLNNLVDCLASFEKILRTPIPMAYSVHLHHATWLYFLALPFQLIEALDWFTVPVVALAAFAMLGILDIGWEIENPFGYDENDLPLDEFCKVIHEEILNIIGNPMPPAELWIFSENNFPLMPKSCLNAKELGKMTEDEIREVLARYRERLWIPEVLETHVNN